MKRIITPILFTLLISCYSESEEELFPVPVATIIPDSISFSMDVFPIIQTNCYGGSCHNNGVSPNLTNYNGVFASAQNSSSRNSLKARITTSDIARRMPQNRSPLPQQEITIITKWIDEGALDN